VVALVDVALVRQLERGIESDEGVLRAEVQRVVDRPVDLRTQWTVESATIAEIEVRGAKRATHLADLASRVEQALEDVLEDDARAEGDPHGLDGVEHRVDDVRRRCTAGEVGQQGDKGEIGTKDTHSQRCWATRG